ncbi:hemagglutinin repeat-containing protein [Dickeya zeae]|uniref:hemagglutinin repeat-containing protein n=1 Tax=Dickeya zeae TaxID=204042 RepID=UPI00215D6888|nr:hemagglutinin repeat-containing protein [Dickeya zeae]
MAGSELIAGEDVTLKGRDVSVVSLENRQDRQETREQKQSGLTIALSGSVGGALNTAVETAQSSRETQDGRVKALQQTKAALSVAQGVQAARLAQAQSEGAGGQQGGQTVGVSVSYGSQSSKSVQEQTQTTAQGSSVTAGRTLSVTATDGDVTVAGSTLKAGQDLLLDASRDIRLLSSANTQHTEGSNQSQGGSIGVSLGVSASGSFGLSVSASVNAAKGSQHGDGVTHTEALLEAGRAAVLHSGRDTTLQGAQVSAETIKAQVGRDLLIRSEQDSDHYDSKQQSMSAGVTIPIYGGGGGASVSFSRDRVNSNFDSVQAQSGLFAGRGGFDVTVGNHTQLDGGAIASTAEAEKNRLDTGTLGFSNIDNHAEYSASHSGGGLGTGGPIGMQMLSNLGGLALAGANQSGSSSGTTYAAVSDGTLIIRDRAGQQQDVSGLSRDTAGANSGALNPIFDKEKVESRMQQAQLMSDIGAQALDIASTEGAIAATKAANEKVAAASAAERRAKGSELAQASPNKAITQDDITQALYQSYYDEAMRTSPYGTGGAVRQGIQAVTAALQGVLAGNMAQALTGAAAPYMAEAIHRATTDAAGNTDVAANTLAHALLGAVVAQASGNNALAGAAGEAGGELAARALMEALYPGKKPSELNEEQKQYISTLATIAGGLAAGVVGNTGADAVQGAQSAQVAAENNFLFVVPAVVAAGEATAACFATGPCAAVVAGVATAIIGNEVINEAKKDDENAPSHTELPIADTDPTGGKLENPAPTENTATTLTTPDQSDKNGASHTGNPDGAPSTAGNTTTTPIPDGPTLDDLFYRNEKIPGLENVRPENPGYPANQDVVNKMNDPKFIRWASDIDCTDCSDIAPKLLDAAGDRGKIIEVRPTTPGSNLSVYENGKVDHEQVFHQVYTDGKYVYDPRLSLKPIPKGDWEKHIKSINPNGVTISDKFQGIKR